MELGVPPVIILFCWHYNEPMAITQTCTAAENWLFLTGTCSKFCSVVELVVSQACKGLVVHGMQAWMVHRKGGLHDGQKRKVLSSTWKEGVMCKPGWPIMHGWLRLSCHRLLELPCGELYCSCHIAGHLELSVSDYTVVWIGCSSSAVASSTARVTESCQMVACIAQLISCSCQITAGLPLPSNTIHFSISQTFLTQRRLLNI